MLWLWLRPEHARQRAAVSRDQCRSDLGRDLCGLTLAGNLCGYLPVCWHDRHYQYRDLSSLPWARSCSKPIRLHLQYMQLQVFIRTVPVHYNMHITFPRILQLSSRLTDPRWSRRYSYLSNLYRYIVGSALVLPLDSNQLYSFLSSGGSFIIFQHPLPDRWGS